jgi:hypothetical protein
MLFNADIFKILHLDYYNNNNMVPYTTNGAAFETAQEEDNLCIVIHEDLKWAKLHAKVVGKANRILGLIKTCFRHLTEDVLLKLYERLVGLQLEYTVQAWRPYLQKDIYSLEKVQRTKGGLNS